ncbi:trypsin-like serine protease [Microbispora sp. NPDC088329]|uniref:trypsin-like serine protease n=1 Tax=Microbispora sp. NPDC088329 TaxID=3154869 RepID=UPI003424564A
MIAGIASPASAITHGSVDQSDHPEVGALIGDKVQSDGTWAYCTGTLISPTVFLTAAHCGGEGQKTARVSFASHYKDGDKVYTGRYIPDSRHMDKSDSYDMAVVVFSAPVPGIKPARLPSLGLLDRFKDDGTLKTMRFTPVGYGSLDPVKRAHKWRFHYTDTRSRTSISFKRLTGRWLELSPNSSRGEGGTCYGDSGGPNYLGGSDSDLLVATTISGVDDGCKSTNVNYRLDTASARQFLGWFVTLP